MEGSDTFAGPYNKVCLEFIRAYKDLGKDEHRLLLSAVHGQEA
jgi:hypothetical protein